MGGKQTIKHNSNTFLLMFLWFILNEKEEGSWIWQRKDRLSLSLFEGKPHVVPTSHLNISLLFAPPERLPCIPCFDSVQME